MIVHTILVPFSWVYGLITGIRNLLYDKSVLKSYRPDIPVILVGNLIAGGTGKSPFIAWLAGELSKKYKVAVLSRGYGRSTQGFQLVDSSSTPETVGDEPMELRLLQPEILIAVDENRKRGILELASGKHGKADIILMDDGFQHRKVTPGYAIVLDNVNRPMRKEKMLPAGLRREPLSALKRADLVLVTKRQTVTEGVLPASGIILITGIAHPEALVAEISKKTLLIEHLKFPDHHRYTLIDALKIRNLHEAFPDSMLVTTGKDFVKLSRIPELAGLPMQWLPAGPPVDPEEKPVILNKIYEYLEKAKRNR